jgi:hypothetical protein
MSCTILLPEGKRADAFFRAIPWLKMEGLIKGETL